MRSKALKKARGLKECMLDHGVPQVSIELRPGRPSSYGVWDSLFVVTNFAHHTVSRWSPTSRTPVLSLVKRGRSDLPGPLANGYGGWDLTYRIITMGYANHPGYGGPIRVPRKGGGNFVIPKDSARRYAWGTEWEGGLSSRDWDRELKNPRNGKTMTFREFMGRSHAAIQDYFNLHPDAHLEHSTWTNRKIDRLGYNRQRGINEINKYRNKKGDWLDMVSENELRKIIRQEIRENVGFAEIRVDTRGKGGKDDVIQPLNQVMRRLLNDDPWVRSAMRSQPDAVANAVIAKLPAPADKTQVRVELSQDQIRDAVRAALVELFESLAEEEA